MPKRQQLRTRLGPYYPYFLILPAVLYYIAFWAIPATSGIALAFQGPQGFTLRYFQYVLRDPYFHQALIYTFVFLVVSVTAEFVLALAVALLINTGFKGASLFLFVALIPMVMPEISYGAIWATGYAQHGWVNSLLVHLGLMDPQKPMAWLAYGQTTRWMTLLIIAEAWRGLPSVMIILLAGLQGISKEYGEAARIFGATGFQTLRKITLPLLKPSIQTALILRGIGAVQIFVIVTVIFGYRNLPVLVEEAVYYFRELHQKQIGAAYALIIMGIVVTLSVLYLWLSGSFRSEEGRGE
ncbi:sugar ABC transporter permease [Candidatus Acetothermia bacterium]|nr:MAG: sugar ABC transporter permease [Candidatus Acetothermia bacterium]